MSSTAAATSTAATSTVAASSATASAASSAAASSVAGSSTAVTSTAAGSSSALTSTSASAASSAAASSQASSVASASTTSTSVSVVNATSSSTSTSHKLSTGAIAGIAGGIGGAFVVCLLAFLIWRFRKEKKGRAPIPPPREVVFTPRAMGTITSIGGANINRASSMSTLLAPGSTQSHSRAPSAHYYNSYPIATPSSMSHDTHLPPSTGSNSSEGSPPLVGIPAPGQAPGLRPALAIDTGLQTDGSGSSDGDRPLPRNKSSVDRLRSESYNGAGPSRAPSPGTERTYSDAGSRPASPHPSLPGMSSAVSRHSFQSSRGPGGFPRPYSTHSMTSSRYVGPVGGAPHQRQVQIQLPRLLGADPDENGDFFHGMPRHQDSMHFHTHDGQMRTPPRPSAETDFGPPSPRRQRVPSGLSTTTNAA